jgi:hypothetical protein
MALRWRLGSLGLIAGLSWSLAAGAAIARDGWSSDSAPGATAQTPADRRLLDSLATDPRLSLFTSRSDEALLRVPLRAGEWTLFNQMQPYAALGPRVLRPDVLDASGLTAPGRESSIEGLSDGLGVGGGVNWRLGNRLGVFGEYLFTPRSRGAASSPAARRDADPPELKGGLSIRF